MAAPVIVMAVATIMTAGCSSGGGLAEHPSSHSTASSQPQPTTSKAAAIPNGPQLGKMLAAAHLPKGWEIAPGGDSIGTSSSMLMAGDGPTPAEYTCKYLDSGASAGYPISWWSSSDASAVLEYPTTAANLPQVTLNVGAYAPGNAAKTMAKLAALQARCRSFRDPSVDNFPTTTSVKTIPHLGDQNLFLTSRERTNNAGTLVGQMFLVRDGNYIVAVDTNTGLDGDVRPATVQGFGAWLLQQLQQANYLS